MKHHGMSVCALASFAALTLSCIAQDSPWNGSWKIDHSTLKYDGPTTTIVADAEGYTLTFGGKTWPKVVCDGKPNAPDDGTTRVCNKVGAGYEVESIRDGKPLIKGKDELSSDGQTLTRTMNVTPPDGSSPFTLTRTSKKVSGGDGMSGTWKETAFTESQDTGVLTIQVNGDSVDFKDTDRDKPLTCKLDGTPTKIEGTSTMTVKQDGPHTLKMTYLHEGKVARESTFILGKDGKTIQETDITPEPSPSKMSVTFNKS